MRKQFYFLLLSVLLSIPLGMKATIVDDPGVFNFSPFYDPSSGVIGLSLTFFPSEEGDTVYIPDYIYENNQYKYVVNINLAGDEQKRAAESLLQCIPRFRSERHPCWKDCCHWTGKRNGAWRGDGLFWTNGRRWILYAIFIAEQSFRLPLIARGQLL